MIREDSILVYSIDQHLNDYRALTSIDFVRRGQGEDLSWLLRGTNCCR